MVVVFSTFFTTFSHAHTHVHKIKTNTHDHKHTHANRTCDILLVGGRAGRVNAFLLKRTFKTAGRRQKKLHTNY